MYDRSAKFYDAIYAFKDYEAESKHLAATIRTYRPNAAALLDVACGTHEHGRFLKDQFAVDGVDLNEEFIAAARAKNPSGRYEIGDMRAFDMGARYDAVLCLFSAIGYVGSSEELDQAIACMAAHVQEGGVLIVEPWFTRENFKPGTIGMTTAITDQHKICRMASAALEGEDIALFDMHFLVGDRSGAVRHFTETHRLKIFSTERTEEAFAKAGLTVSFDPEGITGRGLFIGQRAEG
ncbi:MAG: class I SAM-dependent methyltransferase [Neomegalonema sp.]|nr:class I SAM-dependent methyltransferase [Neomegalonema sp.]